MDGTDQVLLFDVASQQSDALEECLRSRGIAPARVSGSPASGPLNGDLAIVLAENVAAADRVQQLEGLLKRLAEARMATLVLGASDDVRATDTPLVEWLRSDIRLDEVLGKVESLVRYAPLVRRFGRELEHMRRLGEQLNRYFTEIDQEMRLAGRLQRDFLPRRFPSLPPLSFEALYRPASWVSGDMYDVFRVDEHHVGLFVADAMGHGVAAGLLTMFLQQALTSKRIDGSTYSILTPSQALHHLNERLIRQALPNSQFVTAAYAIIDLRSRVVKLARAGHPYPVHASAGGVLREIRSDGSLLGLADIRAEFEEVSFELAPGDKLFVYTDGLEDMLVQPRGEDTRQAEFTSEFKSWVHLPANEFVVALEQHVECQVGSAHPSDDMTVLAIEVARE